MTDAIATDNETLRAIREWQECGVPDTDLQERVLDELACATVLDANALVTLLRVCRAVYSKAVMRDLDNPRLYAVMSAWQDLPPEWRKLAENDDD